MIAIHFGVIGASGREAEETSAAAADVNSDAEANVNHILGFLDFCRAYFLALDVLILGTKVFINQHPC